MSETLEELKSQLELLTAEERAELAHFLIRSLDGEEDDGVEAAWEAELTRRTEEILSGTAIGRPADEVFKELREKYS
jgi:putative addiction module component (TIGR02574 family)